MDLMRSLNALEHDLLATAFAFEIKGEAITAIDTPGVQRCQKHEDTCLRKSIRTKPDDIQVLLSHRLHLARVSQVHAFLLAKAHHVSQVHPLVDATLDNGTELGQEDLGPTNFGLITKEKR